MWGGIEVINNEKTFVTANVLPSYVDCHREGQLPGCLLNTDNDRLDDQCRKGRHGEKCMQSNNSNSHSFLLAP